MDSVNLTTIFERVDKDTYRVIPFADSDIKTNQDLIDMGIDIDMWVKDYRDRYPECAVFDLAFGPNPATFSTDEMTQLYLKLLTGCAYLRARRSVVPGGTFDSVRVFNSVNKLISWLRNTDFFQAPASTMYHDAYAGGLVKHSLQVAYIAAKMFYTHLYPVSFNLEDIVLIALIHDWCKINLYQPYTKNVKNETTQKWESVTAFKHSDNNYVSFGHGVSSLFLAMKFFKLSEEEALAIRWHMGEYNVAQNEMNDLHYANETYPMVMFIQFADRLSITRYASDI